MTSDARFLGAPFKDGANFGTIGAMTQSSDDRQPVKRSYTQKRHKERFVVKMRDLLKKVDNKVMRFLDTRGKKKPSPRHVHPSIELNGGESFKDMLLIAKKYDAKDFFALKRVIPKSSLRFHYRIVAKVYRTSRDMFYWVGIMACLAAKKVANNEE